MISSISPTRTIPHTLLYLQCAGRDSSYTPFCSQASLGQYTLAATSGFGLAHMNQAAFIFHVIFHHLRTIRPPAPRQQLDLGEYQGHRVNDCFFSPVTFQALLISHGLSLPPLSAFPQGKMLSSHISGTAFVPEKGTEEGGNPFQTATTEASAVPRTRGCR